MGLDDTHLSWLPLTAWGVSANIHKLSLSHFQVILVKWANKCSNDLSSIFKTLTNGWSQNWSDCDGPTVLRTVRPLRTLPPQHPLLYHRQQVLLTNSKLASQSLNSFAVTYKNKLWRNEIATKWVAPIFSSNHCDCDRKRVAKQGRRKKKADILFNLAMSGGMSGVSISNTIRRLYRTSATILFHQNMILGVFMQVIIS